MSSFQHLREFIKERLNAATEEIFSEFEKTIVRYEEEIRQLRLLNIRPGIKSHNTGLDDQQVSDQERSSSLDQQNTEPSKIKEVQEEIFIIGEGEQLELKQEAESIYVWTGEQLDLLSNPGLNLTRTGQDDQQVSDQERSSSLDQQNTEPSKIKEEQEEIFIIGEGEQLELKPETKSGIYVWTGEQLDLLLNPGLNLTRIGLDDQQVSDQERSSSLDQQNTEPSKIKEEQEEIFISGEGEQLELKQEAENIYVWTGEQLDLLLNPGVKLTRIGLDDQQVCDQERSSSLHQQDPEPPQTREEQEEMCSSEEGEQLELKQEAEGINVWTGEEVDLLWKSGVKLTTVDLPQQHNCKENEALDDPQVCSQERNPSLNQEDPEQEEMYTNQEGEQLARNQETKGIVVWTGQELGIMWNPEVKLNRIDLPQHDCKDEGGLTDQQVCNRKNNSTLDQEDPSQIKGEQEKLSTTQEGKPLVQKQETGTFSACKESDHSEPGPSSDQLLSHNSTDTDQDERKDDNSHSIKSAQIVSGLTVQNSKTAHLCSTYGKKYLVGSQT
ncbi:nestin-like isoform X3 [Simochromis diagramma]|uniref:nestin-like isoform X3 n=1 Tax=Simochromis diagramma TaxID=43689 RepID=UPI001A7E9516|nr:nestin-like isoform X3 [Simochromis diagramma]